MRLLSNSMTVFVKKGAPLPVLWLHGPRQVLCCERDREGKWKEGQADFTPLKGFLLVTKIAHKTGVCAPVLNSTKANFFS